MTLPVHDQRSRLPGTATAMMTAWHRPPAIEPTPRRRRRRHLHLRQTLRLTGYARS